MDATTQESSVRGRLAIIAGRGRLPLHVAIAAKRAGDDPFVIGLKGETQNIPDDFEHEFVSLGDVSSVHRLVREHGIDRVIMSGGVERRPEGSELRAPLRMIPEVLRQLRVLSAGGDDKLLRVVIAIIEAAGCRVVGAQEIVPDLLAQTGNLTHYKPSKREWEDIRIGYSGADLLGQLDVGQGAVAVGGRIVALEGPEGTDGMLKRVSELRQSGRISKKHKGVLIKLCKIHQDERADLPCMGLTTIENAHNAGLAGVAIEAGRAFILDQERALETANKLGMFILGIDRDDMDEMSKD